MSAVSALAAGTRRGLAGGAAAVAVLLLPPLAGLEPLALADFAATLAALLAVLASARAVAARGAAGFGPQLVATTLAALLASGLIAVANYLLYAWLRPALLAERYAKARALASGHGLATLMAHSAQQLDPAFQAFTAAVTTLFLALVFGAYLAWRARIAARLRGGRSSPRR